MRVFTRISIIVLFLSFLVACEKEETSEVDQTKIYTEYELYYDANLGTTTASALFRNGSAEGDVLSLSSPAVVSFLGNELTYNGDKKTYSVSLDGQFLSGSFVYIDTDNNTYINTIELDSIEFPEVLDPIDRSKDYVFEWEGSSVQEDETVSLNFNDYFSGNVSLFVQNEVDATSLTLKTADLSKLKEATSECILERTINPDISQAPTAGGVIKGRYRPLNQDIVIE